MAVEMQSAFFMTETFGHLRINNDYVEPDMSTQTPSPPLTPTEEPYEIRTMSVADQPRVLDFLRKFFFRDEPLNIATKLLENETTRCPELEYFATDSIEEGSSFLAISASNNIVGVCLNGSIAKDDPEEVLHIEDEKFAKIIKLLETVDKRADIFGQFPDVDKVIMCKILSVDVDWRRRRLGTVLMDKTREYARNHGFPIMRVDCTSQYSAKAAVRLGFECIYSLAYRDYKVNGETVFTPEEPHTEIGVYMQRVDGKKVVSSKI